METNSLSSGFGLEVSGVDIGVSLTDELFINLESIFYINQVLVLRAQSLTPSAFLNFARRLGPPQPHVIDQFHHPELADILILSNVIKNGQPTGLQDAGTYFHTDYSYLSIPARATTLYSIESPQEGGQTLFANQQEAYDDLPSSLKKQIEPLYAIHQYGNRHDTNEKSRTVASPLNEAQKEKMPTILHKIARTHPITSRKSLYAVSGSSIGIEGMPKDEALDLLDQLARHSTQPKYQLSLSYGCGDVVVWDNSSLLHSATLTDPIFHRTLWRVTVLETVKSAFSRGLMPN